MGAVRGTPGRLFGRGLPGRREASARGSAGACPGGARGRGRRWPRGGSIVVGMALRALLAGFVAVLQLVARPLLSRFVATWQPGQSVQRITAALLSALASALATH